MLHAQTNAPVLRTTSEIAVGGARSRRLRRRIGGCIAVFGTLGAALTGCADGGAAREALAPRSFVVQPQLVERALRAGPVAKDQNLRAETLVATSEFSMHLLQFRVGEQRHIHRTHDLTFFVQRGEGTVFVDDRRFIARPGDVFHIPRGTPHYCVNDKTEPLVAVLIFTPPYDMRDSIPAPAPDKSYDREPLEVEK